jgi:hypothetical protein
MIRRGARAAFRSVAKIGRHYIHDFPCSIQNAPVVPGGRADIMVRCPEPSTKYNVNGMGGTMTTIDTTAGPVAESTDLESWSPVYPEYEYSYRTRTGSLPY